MGLASSLMPVLLSMLVNDGYGTDTVAELSALPWPLESVKVAAELERAGGRKRRPPGR